MRNPNLVLVPSFGTNRLILRGLADYLAEAFTVYFIDLPGFTRQVQPLRPTTLAAYSAFVEDKLGQLGLESYWLGGISFGFLVVNRMRFDPRCQAVLGIEPYTDARSLNLSPYLRLALDNTVRWICRLHLYARVWRWPAFHAVLLRLGLPKSVLQVTLEEVDAQTYFETARLLLTHHETTAFHPVPYALILNPNDAWVNYAYVVNLLRRHIHRLLVIDVDVAHYPSDLSREYFRAQLPAARLNQILRFVQHVEKD